MSTIRVVVRADGDAAIGMGHVMRCLALAERLSDRGATVTFLTREEPAVLARITAHRCEVITLPRRGDRAADLGTLLERTVTLGARAAVTDSRGATVLVKCVLDLREEAERKSRARLGPYRWTRAYAAGRRSSIEALLTDIDGVLRRGVPTG